MNDPETKKKILIGVAVSAVALGAIALFFWPSGEETPPVAEAAPEAATQEPAANYPVPPAKADAPPLPALEESDSLFADLFTSLIGMDAVQALLVKEDVARHIVVTVDNLPRKKLAERLKPIKPTAGKFVVSGPDGAQTIAKENSLRYAAAVKVFDTVDTQTLASSYFRVYPLLQQAYVDLGYPTGYFNNRLVEVIDHLLATPDVQGPIQVVQPNVLYEFADPQLEALSSGQKALLRLGPEYAAVVKRKLRELKTAITAKGPA
jgi:hypothetical protein